MTRELEDHVCDTATIESRQIREPEGMTMVIEAMYDGPNGEPGYCKRSNGCMFPKTCDSKGKCQATKK
jgi:hypothetical protein